ncbi:MAG: hypothetical protein AAF919_10130 [Pseudomonadota bacterium]
MIMSRSTLAAIALALSANAALAQDATGDAAPASTGEPAICLAASESQAKCECQAKSLATVFDAEEMAAITAAADAADYAAAAAAITKGIGIDQNKNDFYNAAIESCAAL